MRYRIRHLEQKLREYTGFFKVVLVVGTRQVGKSCLLQHVFPDIRSVVFDPVQDIYEARRDPDLFLDHFPSPVVLDEIQYAPELLAAIKRRVDQFETPGQYILTGSQNLAVMRRVAESMAGRVGILQLDSMTLAEMRDAGEQESWLSMYLADPESFFSSVATVPVQDGGPARFLWRGTLPGLLDAKDSVVPAYMRSYVETYVERDIRVLGDVTDLSDFGRFLRLAAALSGHEINSSQLGRDIGVNPKTARRWLDLLTHSYQWLELPAYHGNTIKRISRRQKGYLADTGLICYLQGISSPETLAANPQLGAVFESWAVGSVKRHATRLGVPPALYHWRTNGGAEVDVVLERDGALFPIEVKCKSKLSLHDARGIRAFGETYGQNAVKTGVIIYAGIECYVVSDHAIALPWTAI